MRLAPRILPIVLIATAACGPTYVVQSAPTPAPERVPVPPRVEPLGISIVRPEEGRVLIQTNRPAYVAVFEVVPGRGAALVYPRSVQPRDVMTTGLTWVNVYWTMRYDYDRRFASSDTRYIYAVASDTPLRMTDDDYDRYHLERRLGSTFYSSSPNATVRAISREFVRAQPDEWWGEDMFTMALAQPRVVIAIRWARVYCPGGNYFEVREDLAEHIWCPARVVTRGRPAVAEAPDSVFGSTGRRVPRRMDPTARTPIFRVPAGTDVGQQQGHPSTTTPTPSPYTPPFPRTQPGNPAPSMPSQNPAPTMPSQNPPPAQNPPPQTQPQTPPSSQPPQVPSQDPKNNGKDHEDNGRRAHGDPRNADPRGNGNGYGNGGREQPTSQPTTQPPQQQGQSSSKPDTKGKDDGKSNNDDHGKNAGNVKPDHNDVPKTRFDAMKDKVKKPDDKKAASDSTDKDKDKKKP